MRYCINSFSSLQTLCLFAVQTPSSNGIEFLDTLYETLCTLVISLFSHFLLLGHFNMDFLIFNHPSYRRLVHITSSFLLQQVVNHLTHFSCTGAPSIIYLNFVSCPSNSASCHTIPPLANSDHTGISNEYKIPTINKRPPAPDRRIWCYSLGDFNRACPLLSDVDWNAMLNNSDVDESWTNWQNRFLNIITERVHQKALFCKRNLPWITRPILNAMKIRTSLLSKLKRKGNPTILSQYKHIRNRLTSELRKAKQTFFS